MKLLFAAFTIATLLVPLLFVQANAQTGSAERTITLKVTNTKTDTIKTRVWDLAAYTFEKEIPIDVPKFRLNKIMRIYGSDSFSFTIDTKVFEREWLHFKVELIGTPTVGKGLSVQFI